MDFLTIVAIAGAAAVASPVGGLVALWTRPTTLFMSLALGFASGVLLGTIAFEMMPQALELSSVAVAVAGFVVGFAAVYALICSSTAASSRASGRSSKRRSRGSTSGTGRAATTSPCSRAARARRS